MYWEPDKECMSRKELEQLQLERLQATLSRVYMNVPFYRRKFDELGIDADEFRSLDDVRKLPFTLKNDLRDSYPYGLFAVPLRDVVRIHASSGTTGLSTVVGYTKNDIKTWSNLVARVMTAAGVTKDDVVQIAFGYSLFTGGFGLHYGAERIGASVIPISSGNTARQIKIMQDFRSTALVCTPSYAMLIADTIQEMGISLNTLSLKYGLFGAEPWSEKMRQEIQDKLKIVATDNYGLSEVMGPGVAGE
ncbi:MAG: phenylacetate--CoA ligase, partial [Thermodesulfovibrio sp.]|nr:phenylacetate--CoA ligase [Thermodesulfovibrio sp.]